MNSVGGNENSNLVWHGRQRSFHVSECLVGFDCTPKRRGTEQKWYVTSANAKGHTAKNCLTGDPKWRKPGKMCRNWGGMVPYARECRTPGRMRTERGSRTTTGQQAQQQSQRLNEGA